MNVWNGFILTDGGGVRLLQYSLSLLHTMNEVSKEWLLDKLPDATKPTEAAALTKTCNTGYKLVRPIRKLQLEWNNAFTKMWDYGPYSEKELEGDGLRPVSEKGEGLIIPHPQRSIYCVLVVNSSSFSVAT